ISVHLDAVPATRYDALVEPGLLGRAGDHVRALLPAPGRLFGITTPPVAQFWGANLSRAMAAAGAEFELLTMPDGEPHKTLSALEGLADILLASGADRDSAIVAFGGGMVGDVAALLASVYMRGLPLVQIPTTLVAMVDSALGGKTAVNLGAGKNLLGTFYHPRMILVDPEVLGTLPEREYRSGLAEAIKYGIIRDAALFAWIESHAADLEQRQPAALEALICACLRHKAEVVAQDERESGVRRTLNFGHTLGHALESATGYQYFLHGEAVAWGMLAAAALAVCMGLCPQAEADRMRRLIVRLCDPLPPIAVTEAEIVRHAASDKKARHGVLHFILPRAIGRVEVVRDVPETRIAEALMLTAQLSQPAR
ncbi:MAG: 3-dehydroquinate synthase, partial [Terriglobales bacterium]